MKKKIVLSFIILIMTLIVSNASFAAVEIVPSKNGKGTDAIVNTTVSNSYLLCQNMKNAGESLKGTSVKPHLATNKDWGAVSYLSNSIYGTNTEGGNTGKEVTINNVKYYSTTTNITGVMNWGSNPNIIKYTQTAGLASICGSSSSWIEELYTNRETEYVEYLDPTAKANTKGMAIHETINIYNTGFYVRNVNSAYPCSIRNGLFNGYFASDARWNQAQSTNGEARTEITFRPVIWN